MLTSLSTALKCDIVVKEAQENTIKVSNPQEFLIEVFYFYKLKVEIHCYEVLKVAKAAPLKHLQLAVFVNGPLLSTQQR